MVLKYSALGCRDMYLAFRSEVGDWAAGVCELVARDTLLV